MRMGEITALTWVGVDLFRRTVTVFRSKNGERRTIPINETVLSLLKDKPESLRDGVEALEVGRTVSTNLAQSPSYPERSLVSC
jgi:integrase